jgi:hypothetical protein
MLYDTPILICCVQERSSLRAREGRGPPQSFQFLIGIYVHVFLLNNIYIYIYDSKLNIRLFFGPVVVLCPCKLNVSRSSLPWCLFCILLVFFLNYYTRRHALNPHGYTKSPIPQECLFWQTFIFYYIIYKII